MNKSAVSLLPGCQVNPLDAYEQITGIKLSFDRQHEAVFTYAVSDGEFIKVGRAIHLVRRLSSLQGGNPRELSLLGFVARDIERTVHKELKRQRCHVRREWFTTSLITLAVLEDNGLLTEST